VFLLGACSTKKNTLINRTYHNTTARYNGYFNAKESIKEGVTSIQNSHKENYEELLPIFIYGDDAAAQSVYPQMDRAIEKCSKVIVKHSMEIKKKEHNKWIDNCYFLIGQAYFYKKDYPKAEEHFKYVIKQYPETDSKIPAMLWLAKTYIENKNFSSARSLLSELEMQPDLKDKIKSEIKQTYADFYIKQNLYGFAIDKLKEAIALEKNKKQKARLSFLLAQIYQKQGNNSEARHYYAQVEKYAPPYEMEFYAKINRALAVGENESASEIEELLKKMLKDEKNKEYFDQIYYALANIELSKGNKPKAVEYLTLSTESSINNNAQKVKSFLKLADLYFEEKNYLKAQAYYDSTTSFISPEIKNYKEIIEKRNVLTRLAKNILTVKEQDSLQKIAQLPKKEQEKLIDKIIADLIEKEEQEKFAQNNPQPMANQNNFNNMMNNVSGGKWYFYNPTTLSYGKTEFKKIWGNRKLEDDWRRKNKTTESVDLGEMESLNDSLAETNKKNPKYYLSKIPDTPEKIEKSHQSIKKALYEQGVIFKNDLKDNAAAIKAFEELVTRYDTSRYHLNAYYQLYLLYKETGDATNAEKYKNIIIEKYPDSDIAAMVINPNYYQEMKERKANAGKDYERYYELYKDKMYKYVLAGTNQAIRKYPDSELLPKFYYLNAMAKSALFGTDSLKPVLQYIVKNYPETPEAKLAQDALNKLAPAQTTETSAESEQENAFNYKLTPDKEHYYVYVFKNDKNLRINDIKVEISRFHQKNFRNDDLKISSMLMGSSYQIVMIKSFSNYFKTMNYHSLVENGSADLPSVHALKTAFFPITAENFQTFYKNADVEGYEKFFEEKYKQ
jgi:TolA-binding protein